MILRRAASLLSGLALLLADCTLLLVLLNFHLALILESFSVGWGLALAFAMLVAGSWGLLAVGMVLRAFLGPARPALPSGGWSIVATGTLLCAPLLLLGRGVFGFAWVGTALVLALLAGGLASVVARRRPPQAPSAP